MRNLTVAADDVIRPRAHGAFQDSAIRALFLDDVDFHCGLNGARRVLLDELLAQAQAHRLKSIYLLCA